VAGRGRTVLSWETLAVGHLKMFAPLSTSPFTFIYLHAWFCSDINSLLRAMPNSMHVRSVYIRKIFTTGRNITCAAICMPENIMEEKN
jgi:hypothetical protein